LTSEILDRIVKKYILNRTKHDKLTYNPIPEEFVQQAIITHLKKLGWSRNEQTKDLHEKGVDIRVTNNKYNRNWLIECKGDARNAKSPNSSKQASFHHVFGQIIKRMKTNEKLGYRYGSKYGVGFPASFKELVIKNLPYSVCFKLSLTVFIVYKNGKVDEFNYKLLKKEQTSL
jgi:hypothetical protein